MNSNFINSQIRNIFTVLVHKMAIGPLRWWIRRLNAATKIELHSNTDTVLRIGHRTKETYNT